MFVGCQVWDRIGSEGRSHLSVLMAPNPGLTHKILKTEWIWILCKQQFLYRCDRCISSNLSTLNHYLLSIWKSNVSVGSCIFICSVWQPCTQCCFMAEALVECISRLQAQDRGSKERLSSHLQRTCHLLWWHVLVGQDDGRSSSSGEIWSEL